MGQGGAEFRNLAPRTELSQINGLDGAEIGCKSPCGNLAPSRLLRGSQRSSASRWMLTIGLT